MKAQVLVDFLVECMWLDDKPKEVLTKLPQVIHCGFNLDPLCGWRFKLARELSMAYPSKL